MFVWTIVVGHAVGAVVNPAVALTGAPMLIAVGLWVWGRQEAKARPRDPENRIANLFD